MVEWWEEWLSEDKQSIQPLDVGESIKPCTNILILLLPKNNVKSCTNILIFLLPKIMLKVQSSLQLPSTRSGWLCGRGEKTLKPDGGNDNSDLQTLSNENKKVL